MTSAEQGSGGWSVRGHVASAVTPGQLAARAITGPETPSLVERRSGRQPGPAHRVGARQLARLSRQLSPRDHAVLKDLAAYGFLTTHQIEQLQFYDHATPEAAARICRRVLARLSRDHLIEALHRRVGGLGAGSTATIWRLGAAGDRLMREQSEEGGPRRRRKQPSLRFLDHRVAVADVACQVAVGARLGHFEVLDLATEPDSWRRFTSGYGETEIIKPDTYLVTADYAFEHHYFIEVDRATESIPTVLRKCDQYLRYFQSGTEQDRSGVFPQVIWSVPDAHRAERLRAALRNAGSRPSLFVIMPQADLLTTLVLAATAESTEGGGVAGDLT